MKFMTTTSLSIIRKMLVALFFVCFLPPVPLHADSKMAVDDTTRSSLGLMRVRKMKAEFEGKGNAYCSKVRREVAPYVKEVCAALADTAVVNDRIRHNISGLQSRLAAATSPSQKYEIAAMLYAQCSIWSFKPANIYAKECERLAREMGDRDRLVQALVFRAKLYTTCGFFREAAEVLVQADTTGCTVATRTQYLVAQFNVEFEDGFYYPRKAERHNVYLERMQRIYGELRTLVSADSYLLDDMKVKMNFNTSQYAKAVECSKQLLAKLPQTDTYYAYAMGNLGFNYMGLGDYTSAARCVAQSALAEIRRGSKEYPAARKIAEIAYIMGMLPESYMLIRVAMHNAETFNSRYRYSEIATSYPKIENDLYEYTCQQKRWLTVALGVLLAVAMLLVAAIVMMLRQRRILHRQKSLIEKQVARLSSKSEEIETINRQLQEAGHIKEVVLGQLIIGSANHQSAIERLRKEVLRRLAIRDYEGLRTVFDRQNGPAFDSFYQIDQILLMLFPDFPERFNALLRPEHRTAPRKDERFTTEMRIFALIRLGITKNDDLARSLNYSVNTIKSYKTRVLAASIYSKEEFYERLQSSVPTVLN